MRLLLLMLIILAGCSNPEVQMPTSVKVRLDGVAYEISAKGKIKLQCKLDNKFVLVNYSYQLTHDFVPKVYKLGKIGLQPLDAIQMLIYETSRPWFINDESKGSNFVEETMRTISESLEAKWGIIITGYSYQSYPIVNELTKKL